ncbi:MAG: aldehyde dehydrogenase family protein [Rhizobacter sp.]|nr:aldehyde dehydrogenase family protein [Bacteriovorax sp.]
MIEGFSRSLDETYNRIKTNFATKPRDFIWRKSQLEGLKKLLVENDEALNAAMWKDLHKPPFECSATEQGIVISEIDFMLSHLESLMKPTHVSTPLYNQIGSSMIVHEPFGITLVIGAWNYPINLLLAPVVGAIAGGNAVIVKPSEISAHTGHLIAELIPKYLDTDLIGVVEGGPEETGLLLDKKFDLIFFTGSGTVGKIVMAKAVPNLTPVILELGGKSPAMILADADIHVTAKRLTWGKCMNAGQTCVAPDYVLIHSSVKEKFITEMRKTIGEFYGESIVKNDDYCRIINQKNFDRLVGLISGSNILLGGATDNETLFIEPTLLESTGDSKVMQEEIFGPLLPVIVMDDLDSMIEFVNARAKPLALYLFTEDDEKAEKVIRMTSSGGVSVNDVIMHMASPTLPFGGVGASGMGNYHGDFSFRTFTHAKAVIKKSTAVDVPLRYAPYTETKLKWMKRFFK